ncbi:MAG TPA: response regulator transcription factor [Verrucomicrobiae bacterium]|nr:response regulator transcription factor [Verrucomicrobiae bacterium]
MGTPSNGGSDAMNADGARSLRVWLVDDSENFRVLLAALLEDESGFKCERQFPDAESVLEALGSGHGPDVILLDVRMPGMGGVAAVAPIRELAPATRVLMLTTFGNEEARAQTLHDGATDFLLKSYSVQEIAERVRSAMTFPLEASAIHAHAAVKTEAIEHRDGSPTVHRAIPKHKCRSNRLVRGFQCVRGWLAVFAR